MSHQIDSDNIKRAAVERWRRARGKLGRYSRVSSEAGRGEAWSAPSSRPVGPAEQAQGATTELEGSALHTLLVTVVNARAVLLHQAYDEADVQKKALMERTITNLGAVEDFLRMLRGIAKPEKKG